MPRCSCWHFNQQFDCDNECSRWRRRRQQQHGIRWRRWRRRRWRCGRIDSARNAGGNQCFGAIHRSPTGCNARRVDSHRGTNRSALELSVDNSWRPVRLNFHSLCTIVRSHNRCAARLHSARLRETLIPLLHFHVDSNANYSSICRPPIDVRSRSQSPLRSCCRLPPAVSVCASHLPLQLPQLRTALDGRDSVPMFRFSIVKTFHMDSLRQRAMNAADWRAQQAEKAGTLIEEHWIVLLRVWWRDHARPLRFLDAVVGSSCDSRANCLSSCGRDA